jgi:hypothetical protein
MSSHAASHGRAALALAIAVLPWIAFSRVGEWGTSSGVSLRREGGAIEALMSRSVLMPDRVLFSATGSRADGTPHISPTQPHAIAVSALPPPGWELCLRGSVSWTEPTVLHPTCRGPPGLASGSLSCLRKTSHSQRGLAFGGEPPFA